MLNDLVTTPLHLTLDTHAPPLASTWRRRIAVAEPTSGDYPEHAHAHFVHEVRNLVNVAVLSLEVLKITGAGVAGVHGGVLTRSLLDLRTLIDRSVSDLKAPYSGGQSADILLADFINDMEAAATLEAQAKGIRLVIPPVDESVVVAGDRQELGAVVRNLLQNAFKFTKPDTKVVLRVTAGAERVLIEVEDQCGGLPDGCTEDLFRPFEQRGQDRSGLGLGLAFCRAAVETGRGRISARSRQGYGCVFTVDLPRSARPDTRTTATAGLHRPS